MGDVDDVVVVAVNASIGKCSLTIVVDVYIQLDYVLVCTLACYIE